MLSHTYPSQLSSSSRWPAGSAILSLSFLVRPSDTVAKALGEYGATRVLSVTDPAIDDYLVAPKAEALAQIADSMQPAAILITSTPEGKEIAGRLAVKLGVGPDHRRHRDRRRRHDRRSRSSRVTGRFSASVTHGAPVITVKPNAVNP